MHVEHAAAILYRALVTLNVEKGFPEMGYPQLRSRISWNMLNVEHGWRFYKPGVTKTRSLSAIFTNVQREE